MPWGEVVWAEQRLSCKTWGSSRRKLEVLQLVLRLDPNPLLCIQQMTCQPLEFVLQQRICEGAALVGR